MSCSSCYECKLPTCASIVDVLAGLAANTAYKVRITDKFGTFYSQDVTTDGAGNFELDLSQFEEGVFTPHSGTFILTILDSSGEKVTMTFNDTEYTCVSFSMYDTNVPAAYLSPQIPNADDEASDPVPAAFMVQEIEYTAAENIGQYEVVTNDNKQADSSDVTQANLCLALSITTTTSGNKGLAIVKGQVINSAWTWTIDADIYLNGTTLSETAPTSGFAIVIGKASRTDAIVVNIGSPTLL